MLEKIKSDPQSGSCPNLVYNMGSAAAVLNGSLLDPTSYAAAASAVNLENLLKLAYASAATNQYATLTTAAANPAAAASFAYPAGKHLTFYMILDVVSNFFYDLFLILKKQIRTARTKTGVWCCKRRYYFCPYYMEGVSVKRAWVSVRC